MITVSSHGLDCAEFVAIFPVWKTTEWLKNKKQKKPSIAFPNAPGAVLLWSPLPASVHPASRNDVSSHLTAAACDWFPQSLVTSCHRQKLGVQTGCLYIFFLDLQILLRIHM